jgi:hypothetical protein
VTSSRFAHIAVREYLCLTLCLDHDVIDGAPAARSIKRLTDLIERGAWHNEKSNVTEVALITTIGSLARKRLNALETVQPCSGPA